MKDSNSEMSSQIIPLKGRTDLRESSRIPAMETIRVRAAAPGYAAQGWVLPGSSASVAHGRWPSCGVAEKARIGRDLFQSEDDPPAAKPANLCGLCDQRQTSLFCSTNVDCHPLCKRVLGGA